MGLDNRNSGLSHSRDFMSKRVSPRTGWPAVILRLALAQVALGIREQDYCSENREQTGPGNVFSANYPVVLF